MGENKQETKQESRTIAFKLAYLLGVENKVLERDYPVPFAASNKCALFENYQNAPFLRAISRIRQAVMKYPAVYRKGISFEEAAKGHLILELKYLLENGVDIEDMYAKYTKEEFVNCLSKKIEGLVDGVLKVLSIPRRETLAVYFKYPIFDKASLDLFFNTAKEHTYPHGIIIITTEDVKSSLAYSLMNDMNLYCTAYSILGVKYDKGVAYSDDYIWSTTFLRAADVTDVDTFVPPNYIEEVPILDFVDAKSIKINKNVLSQIVGNKGLVAKVKSLINDKKTELFVDCDNIEFFGFLNFIIQIEKSGLSQNIQRIHLIVDVKSTVLWKVFTELYKGVLDINIITVKRLKEQKSVADIVLVSKMCEQVYKYGLQNVFLISSDSDFFGAIQQLAGVVQFNVGYTGNCTNEEYLKYLAASNVGVIDLAVYDASEVIEEYKNICVQYLLAYTIILTAISKWDENSFISSVLYHFNQESTLEITVEYITKIIHELLPTLSINYVDSCAVVKVGDVEIKSTQVLVA